MQAKNLTKYHWPTWAAVLLTACWIIHAQAVEPIEFSYQTAFGYQMHPLEDARATASYVHGWPFQESWDVKVAYNNDARLQTETSPKPTLDPKNVFSWLGILLAAIVTVEIASYRRLQWTLPGFLVFLAVFGGVIAGAAHVADQNTTAILQELKADLLDVAKDHSPVAPKLLRFCCPPSSP